MTSLQEASPSAHALKRWLTLSAVALVLGVLATAACNEPTLIDDDDSCDAFEDDEGAPVTITIENARPTPVFFAQFEDCMGTLDPELFGPQGESRSLETSSCGLCSRFDDGGDCFDAGDCFSGASLVMLAPGAKAVVTWSAMELEAMTMPYSCDPLADEGAGEFTCYRRKVSPSGRYSVRVNAIPSATCASFQDGTPKPCLCTPAQTEGPNATCLVFEPTVEMAQAFEVVAELDYPEDQEVTLRIE